MRSIGAGALALAAVMLMRHGGRRRGAEDARPGPPSR